jgi:hypothetical protein
VGVTRFARVAREAFAVARRFATDPEFRARVRRQLPRESARPEGPGHPTPYAGLVSSSTALSDIRVTTAPRQVNVVVGSVGDGKVFAGIDTALRVAALLAARLELPLRVLTIDAAPGTTPSLEALRTRYQVPDLTLVSRETIGGATFAGDDVWVATHFFTAHAVQVACELGLVDARNVVYLIQDYEPGFVPWSTEYAVAQATYHAGFIPLVNSLPVARHLEQAEGISIPRTQVFGPAFDLARLSRAAETREPAPGTRIAFYGRPSKHRNLFRLGVAALRLAAERLGPDRDVTFVSVGEPHGAVELAAGHTMASRGTLAWDEYFEFLSQIDVLLSLQLSPHPSHPPLEAAISGAWAVTNDVGNERAGLHPRLSAVPARVDTLAEAILAAADQPAGSFHPLGTGLLGGDLAAAVDAVVERLRARS